MQFKILGSTGLFVSEQCLGTMNFGTNLGNYAAAGGLEEREAPPLFTRTFDAGIGPNDAGATRHRVSHLRTGKLRPKTNKSKNLPELNK